MRLDQRPCSEHGLLALPRRVGTVGLLGFSQLARGVSARRRHAATTGNEEPSEAYPATAREAAGWSEDRASDEKRATATVHRCIETRGGAHLGVCLTAPYRRRAPSSRAVASKSGPSPAASVGSGDPRRRRIIGPKRSRAPLPRVPSAQEVAKFALVVFRAVF